MSSAGSTLTPVFESLLFESFYRGHETWKRQLAPIAFISKHQRSETLHPKKHCTTPQSPDDIRFKVTTSSASGFDKSPPLEPNNADHTNQ
ncbi:hypothetical protein HO133_003913 [Letharia lupina]|uniref:Uncharacterized protein n=1 Tax=Letharia lupina TaxID=560253 RepID=A0A8H6C9P0_9LECA|nr:uncharacterized protein HO133_003913 [Letharia lupina]KAF6219447.1 hypothetical protein HO133_003913 [Letharia lupina]